MLALKSKYPAQLPIQNRHRGGPEPSDGFALQPGPVNEAGMVGQCGGLGVQPGLVRCKPQMNRVLRRRFRQRHNSHQRTARLVVGVCRDNHHRSGEPLFMTLNGVEAAPVNLAFFDYHRSSLQSTSDVRSQSRISACCLAASAGSAADCSNARFTSPQKVFSSSSRKASSITWALGRPSFDASAESTRSASSFMRTLVAMFGIVEFYHSGARAPVFSGTGRV